MKNPFRKKPKVKFYSKGDYEEFVKDFGEGSEISKQASKLWSESTPEEIKADIFLSVGLVPPEARINFETLTEYNGVSTEA